MMSMPRFDSDRLTSSNEVEIENLTTLPTINSRHWHSLIDASYKGNNEAKQIGMREGYKLDEELSNRKHKVFRDKHDTTIIAFTGSRTFGDVITDGALVVGLHGLTYRFADSTRLVDKVKEKYKHSPIMAVGHSLGARLGEYVNETTGVDRVVSVQKGTGLFDIGKRLKSNQTDIHSNTDWVSVLSNTQVGGKHINNPGTLIFDPLYSHSYSHLKKFGNKDRF